MKPVGGISSWLVRFTVLQKSGLQNANLELCFDCYLPKRGREQTLALSLLVPSEGHAIFYTCRGCKCRKCCTGSREGLELIILVNFGLGVYVHFDSKISAKTAEVSWRGWHECLPLSWGSL